MKNFNYNGMTFEPVRELAPGEVNKLYAHAGRKIDIPNYSHESFYEAARKAGAAKIDLFKTGDRVFIPCGGQAIEWREIARGSVRPFGL
jgi:hypothetical protein